MRILTLPCGPIMANSYIVCREGSATCAVIDPADAALIYDRLQKEGLVCTHIMLPHGHFDHVWGVAGLKEKTGAKVYLHQADADMAAGHPSYFSAMGQGLTPCRADVFLHEGDRIEAGGLTFRVLETPGHTKGGVCFAVDGEKAVFTGDTLFCESVGRTDLGGDIRELMDSLFHKLYVLDGYTVYPGHEESTTIEHEKQFNPMNAYRNHPWFS